MSVLSVAELDILLVEPSATQYKIINEYLEEIGTAAVTRVENGEQTLATVGTRVPDLVISAMHLADMSGTELLQSLRNNERTLDLPFMLISSETHLRYLEPLRQAGVIAILPKPFDKQQLQASLNAVLDFLDPEPLELNEFAADELKVLIVDDSFTSRHIVRHMLEGLGIEQFAEAENGKQALQMINDEFFDLVVTDYNMPEMDGEQLSQLIRSQSTQPSIPVLMVTSETDQGRLAGVRHSGVSAIFDKPLTVDSLRGALQRLLV
jgi:two-component system chemotaxis response regulator CheY